MTGLRLQGNFLYCRLRVQKPFILLFCEQLLMGSGNYGILCSYYSHASLGRGIVIEINENLILKRGKNEISFE